MTEYLSYGDWVDTMDTVCILPVNDAWEYQQNIINVRDVEIDQLKVELSVAKDWRNWHISEINRLRVTPRKLTVFELCDLIESTSPESVDNEHDMEILVSVIYPQLLALYNQVQ